MCFVLHTVVLLIYKWSLKHHDCFFATLVGSGRIIRPTNARMSGRQTLPQRRPDLRCLGALGWVI